MKVSRASLTFNRPPHSESTLEAIAADALRKHDRVLPSGPGPVSIDRFVEDSFGFNETYERLEHDVLGEIHFGTEEKPVAIRLARRLGDLRSSSYNVEQERRGTLAHEAGHGIAHSKLFSANLRRDGAPLLPGFAYEERHIVCRGPDLALDTIRPKPNSAAEIWLEWEANYLMGALLLPRHLVLELISTWLVGEPDGIAPRHLPENRQHAAVTAVADVFEVSLDLAARRLRTLIPVVKHPDFFDAVPRSRSPRTQLRNGHLRRNRPTPKQAWSR